MGEVMTLGELTEFERPAKAAAMDRWFNRQQNPDAPFAPLYTATVNGQVRHFSRESVDGLGFSPPEDWNFRKPGGWFHLFWDHVETVGELVPIEAMEEICRQLMDGDRVRFATRPPKVRPRLDGESDGDYALVGTKHAVYYGTKRGYCTYGLALEDHGFVPSVEVVFMLRQ